MCYSKLFHPKLIDASPVSISGCCWKRREFGPRPKRVAQQLGGGQLLMCFWGLPET
jgi:hypothetical protein